MTRPDFMTAWIDIAFGFAILVAAFFFGPEDATAGPLKNGLFQGVSVTTSDQIIIGPGSVLSTPANFVSTFLYLENVSQSATFCINFGAPATITGTACSAGEITLQPGAFRFFDIAVPTDIVHAIGSAAGGLTVGVQ